MSTATMAVRIPAREAVEPREQMHEASVLTGGAPTTRITHLGQIYTLRITRQGKLILTK